MLVEMYVEERSVDASSPSIELGIFIIVIAEEEEVEGEEERRGSTAGMG